MYADVSLFSTAQSHYLKATNFGFSIPAGAIITGIIVSIDRKASVANAVTDNRVRIVKGGAIGATNKTNAGNWPTSDASVSYGSEDDLWGETWTVDDINASDFGVAISALGINAVLASVDYISITVHYLT